MIIDDEVNMLDLINELMCCDINFALVTNDNGEKCLILIDSEEVIRYLNEDDYDKLKELAKSLGVI